MTQKPVIKKYFSSRLRGDSTFTLSLEIFTSPKHGKRQEKRAQKQPKTAKSEGCECTYPVSSVCVAKNKKAQTI
jgi:hypothetical protein